MEMKSDCRKRSSRDARTAWNSLSALVRNERIVHQDLQVESRQLLRNEPSDVAETDQAEGLSRDLRREIGIGVFFPPFPGLEGVMRPCDVASLGEQQADREIGNRVGVPPHDVVHHDPALRRGRHVEVLLAGPGGPHETQVGQRIHGGRRDRGEQRQEHFRALVGPQDLRQHGLGRWPLLLHDKTPVLELDRVGFPVFRGDLLVRRLKLGAGFLETRDRNHRIAQQEYFHGCPILFGRCLDPCTEIRVNRSRGLVTELPGTGVDLTNTIIIQDPFFI